jgi:phosphoglycolate phosphatase-like HAD superfamily hydrolase
MSNQWGDLAVAQRLGSGMAQAQGPVGDAELLAVKSSVSLPLESAGLLFDTADVLFDATAWWHWLVQLLSRMGLRAHYPTLFRLWKHEYLSQVNCGRRNYWEAFQAFLHSAGLSRGQIEEVLIASEPKQRHFHSTMRLLPGVPWTLAQLASRGMPMGVLSYAHTSCQSVAEGLQKLGIGSYFRACLSSSELGFLPREGRGFRAAADAMHMAVTDLAFVGHDTDELAGARAAGMPTIAFNYDQDARADVFLDRFDQLMAVVRVKSTRRRAG